MLKILTCTTLTTLIACGAPEAGTPPTDTTQATKPMGTSPTSTNTTTTSSTDASALLADFGYDKIKTDVTGYGSFAEQPNGTNIFEASLFLYTDKTFELFYREGVGSVDSGGGGGNFPGRGKSVSGNWSWDGAKLTAGNYLSCNQMTFNDKPTLYCEIKASLQSAAAVGAKAKLQRAFGAHSADDSRFASEYDPL